MFGTVLLIPKAYWKTFQVSTGNMRDTATTITYHSLRGVAQLMIDETRAFLQLLGSDSWGSNQVDLMVCSAHTGLIRVKRSGRT